MPLAEAILDEPELPGAKPRCTLKHAREAQQHYAGRARAPLLPDEHGAVNVMVLHVGGERLAFVYVGDGQCESKTLPAVPR